MTDIGNLSDEDLEKFLILLETIHAFSFQETLEIIRAELRNRDRVVSEST